MEIHSVFLLTLTIALLGGVLEGAKFRPHSSMARKCKCVPDQWEGNLASTEREFDLKGGNQASMDNNLYVSYDYRNKRFSMTDLKTGYKAIADYHKGFKYVLREDGCRGFPTLEGMRQMCLPEQAEYLGEYLLGADEAVDLWKFSGPYNITMKTTVIQKNCVPVTEEVYMSKDKYVSLQTSLYLDVTVGIKDESVFQAPLDCMLDAFRRPSNEIPRHMKRAQKLEGMWSLLSMLRANDVTK